MRDLETGEGSAKVGMDLKVGQGGYWGREGAGGRVRVTSKEEGGGAVGLEDEDRRGEEDRCECKCWQCDDGGEIDVDLEQLVRGGRR